MIGLKNKNNVVLLIAVITITVFGIMMIYSASAIWAEYKFHDQFKFLKMQSLFFFVGLIIMYILSNIDYHIYERHSNKILLMCAILLILVLIIRIC